MNEKKLKLEELYRIKKDDLEKLANVAAQAFIDDESSRFLLASKLTIKTLYDYYLVIYKALYKKMYLFADSKNIDGFIIIAPVENSVITIFDFIKAGGLNIIFSQGLGLVFRSLKYENNNIRIRKKIIKPDTWYIFQFGVLPDKQKMGLGSKTMKPFLKWLDSQKLSCYLETQKECNVDIYAHFGFSLKSTDTLPNGDKKQFAMLRN